MTTNNVESGIGGLRSVAGSQTERADVRLLIEAMKYSVNTIADVSYQYEQYTGKLWDRDKCVAKHFTVIRRRKKNETFGGTHVRMAVVPSEDGDLVRWRLVSIEVSQYERYADTQALKVFPTSSARAASQRHTEHGHHNMVELRMDVFQDVEAMKEHKSGLRSVDDHWEGDQDREARLILETSWYHVGQIEAENSG